MIIRLVLFVAFYLLAIGVPITAVGYGIRKALGPALKRRKAKKLAARHAKLLAAHMMEEDEQDNDEQQCFHCFQHCTEEDCYEEGKGWYHEKCLKELLGS